jgi:glutamyl-Q tRNA(Asp) synthetase
LFTYQLAVVVDDAAQHITHIVRGSDLLDSTPRQVYLQRLLGLPTPRYSHLPLAVDHHGHKLSKQTRASPLDRRKPGTAIVRALQFLNQHPPQELVRENLETIWSWALAHWRPEQIPAERTSAGPALDRAIVIL